MGQGQAQGRRASARHRRRAAQPVRPAAPRARVFAFRFQPHDYEAFAASFGFEETPDQHAAIHAVIQDMVSPRPMDRLVCGDVGFGKTEVALRAAFVAVTGGKQVAILAPTTLLAEQHHQNIADRFGKWPIKVAELSRFRSPKEVKAALAGIEDGTVDIVVGTHKLLSADVKFARLGLLVIDEGAPLRRAPQGADQGDACRGRCAHAHRHADPAHARHGPRRPARSVGHRHGAAAPPGDQDLRSQRGLEHDPRGGAARAQERGGQVYFLHNDVATIEHRRETLQALVPEARNRRGRTARCPSASSSA